MKKWLVGGVLILILFLLGCQFFIPPKMVITKSIVASANQNAVFRFLSNDSNWKKWWPNAAGSLEAGATLRSGNLRFQKKAAGFNSFEIAITNDKTTRNSTLNLLAIGTDSLQLVWSTTLETANNPFEKINLYFEARKIKNSLEPALLALRSHIGQVKNLYGFDIRAEKIKIEFMVSTRRTFPRYPTTDDIYGMIRAIEKHIAQQKAKIEHPPIMHISAEDSINFDVLVAIPVERQLPDSGIFQSKKMLRNGNMLVTETSGSRYMAESALKQIDNFAFDHQLRSIALPFQSFLTDRTLEADTSKWKTLIGYPVL